METFLSSIPSMGATSEFYISHPLPIRHTILNRTVEQDQEIINYFLKYKDGSPQRISNLSGWKTDTKIHLTDFEVIKNLLLDVFNLSLSFHGMRNTNKMFITPESKIDVDAEVWFAEYQPGDCAEEHDHAGQSRTSFCYYLDAETNSSPLTFVQKEWTNNGPMTVSKTNLPVAQGLLAMWPSVLKHEVAKTDKRRYIIAGNINDLSYKEDY
jgi:hypothetical protein